MTVLNALHKTYPGVIHANGSSLSRPDPKWEAIKRAASRMPAQTIGPSPDISVITLNNTSEKGLLERSLERLGAPYIVAGRAISPWVNALHKPQGLLEALAMVHTKYCLYADSFDALLLSAPDDLLSIYLANFTGASLVFGAGADNFPPDDQMAAFDSSRPGACAPFRHLNSGAWIGEANFARQFFEAVMTTDLRADYPWSEQGRVRTAFQCFADHIALDYRCRIFQNNASRLAAPYLEIVQ